MGAKINKIFQPEKDELHFLLFNNGNFRLVMSANASVNRFCVTAYPAEKSAYRAVLCMLLRKACRRRDDLRRKAAAFFERVVELTVENKNELGYRQLKRLVFEVTGKSANIILTDENYTITDSLKRPDAELTSKKTACKRRKVQIF